MTMADCASVKFPYRVPDRTIIEDILVAVSYYQTDYRCHDPDGEAHDHLGR